jgi:hypothetical protein
VTFRQRSGELDEDPVIRLRVEEANHAREAETGLLVDELDAFLPGACECRINVV